MSNHRTPLLTHPLNLLLLASAGASAAWVGDWRPLAVGAVSELLWWGLRPMIDRRQRVAARRLQVDAGEQDRLRTLSEPLRRRYLELDRVRADIRRLGGANEALSAAGFEEDLVKVDRLLASWLDLASSVAHMRAIAADTDIAALEGAASADESAAGRLAEARAAQSAGARSEAALERVESDLRGLRDRVVSMSTPRELGGELEALLGGVEAAARTAQELQALEAGSTKAARAARVRASNP